MEIYNNSQYIHGAHNLQGPHRTVPAQESSAAATRYAALQDDIQFSDEALQLSSLSNSNSSSSSGIRFDLVNRIKAEIAAGTYDTPDKMDIAVDRMIGRLQPR
ncbi:MAG: flagellar biosynthesis anti-sigma factor FlgM [Planctomycetaceae bacterium]|jgi:negative regulator of flagellin synthesis FlgM|nr:flagellar biosynthesis anti-sigma factor FlgM [Planctomycetaceae bacterium]